MVFQGFRSVTLDRGMSANRSAGTRRFDWEKAHDYPIYRARQSERRSMQDCSDKVTAEAQLKDIRETPGLAGCMKRIKI